MYEVATRTVPERSLLCQLRHVADEKETFALGKAFLAIFKERPQPLVTNAPFLILIYHGEVSADSDGPVEFCRPVAAEQAEQIAALYPEFSLRVEPAHEEAFVHIGQAQLSGASGSSSRRACAAGAQPSDGCRVSWVCGSPTSPSHR